MAVYEVSAVVQGKAERVEVHRTEGLAYAAADRLAKEIEESASEGVTWHVYVTPFSCRPDDDDDYSQSWMPDVRPYRAS